MGVMEEEEGVIDKEDEEEIEEPNMLVAGRFKVGISCVFPRKVSAFGRDRSRG